MKARCPNCKVSLSIPDPPAPPKPTTLQKIGFENPLSWAVLGLLSFIALTQFYFVCERIYIAVAVNNATAQFRNDMKKLETDLQNNPLFNFEVQQ